MSPAFRFTADACPHPPTTGSDRPAQRYARAAPSVLAWRNFVHEQRFAVEFERRTVGIAVRVPGGFMFYSSDDRFEQMDGQVFPRARAIERQLRRVAARARPVRGLQRLQPSYA